MYILLEEVSYVLDFYITKLNHLSSLYTVAPVIDTPLSPILVAIDATLTLSCTSQGSIPDTFMWRKDNDPTVLQSNSISAVEYNRFRADYSIENVTTNDNGTYTCTATNHVGSDSVTITVYVIGKFFYDYKDIYMCM